jgi:hypothetical protein
MMVARSFEHHAAGSDSPKPLFDLGDVLFDRIAGYGIDV